MTSLFEGPFYDQLLSQHPLRSATYFKHGSSTILFRENDRLYRLTRQGCGHNFISQQSALGNPHVPHVIEDFGAVAPSDEGEGEFYWLAEIEWLQDLDPAQPQTQSLNAIITDLTEDEPQLYGGELEDFISRCSDLAKTRTDLHGLLSTLMAASAFAMAHQAMADIKLDNIMLRAASNELVVADPICDNFFEISDIQRSQMMMRISS
jgi:hypothetical protein